MNNHLKRLNGVVKLILGAEHEVSEETAKAIAQEVINEKYRRILKDNLNFNQALEMLAELSASKSKSKK